MFRALALSAFAAAVSYYDLRYRRVPNALVLAFLAGGSVVLACNGLRVLGRGLWGMLLGFMVLLPAYSLRVVGGGDVKALAVIGLLTGPSMLWPAFFLGASAAGVAGGLLIVSRRLPRHGTPESDARAASKTLPYAAFLSLSAALCAFFLTPLPGS